jgi:phage shock protein A
MKRLKEISEQIKESINQFIEEAENNESLLENTVVDMKKRLAKAKELVATAIAELQRLKQAYQESVDAVEMWSEKVDAALNDNDAERATEAQNRKQQNQQHANDLEKRILAQQNVVDDLKTTLLEFYRQFQDTSKRATKLAHRQKQAKTRAEFYKLMAEFELLDTNLVLEQAEQKLEAAEDKAETWERLNRRTAAKVEKSKDDFDVDEALAALKSDVLGNSQK